MSIRNSEAFAPDDFTKSRLSMGICNSEIASVQTLHSEKEENMISFVRVYLSFETIIPGPEGIRICEVAYAQTLTVSDFIIVNILAFLIMNHEHIRFRR